LASKSKSLSKSAFHVRLCFFDFDPDLDPDFDFDFNFLSGAVGVRHEPQQAKCWTFDVHVLIFIRSPFHFFFFNP